MTLQSSRGHSKKISTYFCSHKTNKHRCSQTTIVQKHIRLFALRHCLSTVLPLYHLYYNSGKIICQAYFRIIIQLFFRFLHRKRLKNLNMISENNKPKKTSPAADNPRPIFLRSGQDNVCISSAKRHATQCDHSERNSLRLLCSYLTDFFFCVIYSDRLLMRKEDKHETELSLL